jgi:hypothetical protein
MKLDLQREVAHLLIRAVDTSLLGSEYGLEAWNLIKQCIEAKSISLEDFEQLEALIDLAEDDVEGPKFQIDLSRGKMYA